jgi:protease-4
MSKSTKWFLGILLVLAVVAAGITILFLAAFGTSGESTETVWTGGSGGKIAVVDLKGEILSSDEVVRQVKKYREDRSIKAILLHIDSPGGAVVPSQEMYEEVRKTRDGGKPVVVSMGSLAASGGYYVACGGSRLVANRGTLTGSIGVISMFLQMEEALKKLGLGVRTIKSGKLKDAGVSTRSMTAADEKYFQQLMDDVHRQFMEVVSRERKLSVEKIRGIADGRVYTGEQAVKLGLIDTLGTFQDAVSITARLAGIIGEPTLVKTRKRQTFVESLLGDAAETAKELKQQLLSGPVLSYRYPGPQ